MPQVRIHFTSFTSIICTDLPYSSSGESVASKSTAHQSHRSSPRGHPDAGTEPVESPRERQGLGPSVVESLRINEPMRMTSSAASRPDYPALAPSLPARAPGAAVVERPTSLYAPREGEAEGDVFVADDYIRSAPWRPVKVSNHLFYMLMYIHS